MIDLPAFLTLVAVLAAPGPTNVLLAAAAVGRGSAARWLLLPPVVLAYLVSVGAFTLLDVTLGGISSSALAALRLCLVVYVLRLAWRLWRSRLATGPAARIEPGSLFLATLLNPKGPAIALGVLPAPVGLPGTVASFAVLSLSIVVIGGLWIAAGSLVGRFDPSGRRLAVAAAVSLLVFAGLIAAPVFR